MKKFITLVCTTLTVLGIYAQNVGIGTNSPGTKLDVSGAITLRETSVAVVSNAATIPANVSQVQLTGAASATITVTAPAAPANAGQTLVIFNNTTGGFAATYGSTSIPAGTAIGFIYSASAWQATSSAASGSGNYVQNRTTTQPSSDFNVSNTGTVGTTFTAGTSVTSPAVQGSTAAGGTLTLRATSSATKPAAGILMTDNIASTSPTTGTAVITGGAGISGNVYAGGNFYAGANAVMGTGVNGGYYQDAVNGAYRSMVSSATDNGYYFQTNTGAATTMWIGLGGTYNGRIGIGTTAPAAALQLYQDRYTLYGPNTSWSALLRIGGNGNVDNNASIAATNGNLHIDASGVTAGYTTYINYYKGTGGIIFGNGATGAIGSIDNTGYLTTSNVINSTVGFRVNTAAPSGQYLRGNGTNFVASAIQASDLSLGISGATNTIPKFTGTNTIGNSLSTDDGTTVTTAGQLDVTGGSGTLYTTAPIEVRTTLTPRISFHWPGVVASQIGMNSAGVIRTYDNPGTGYADFGASNIVANGGNVYIGAERLQDGNPYINLYAGNNGTAGIHFYRNDGNSWGYFYADNSGIGILKDGSWAIRASGPVNGTNTDVSLFTDGGVQRAYLNSAGFYFTNNNNPQFSAVSYFVASGGAYFNSGTVYTEAQYQCRGGIHNDVAGDLTIAGGSNGTTYFSGAISGMSGFYPPNNMVRLTSNLHLNSGAGNAVILNWDNGTTGTGQALRVGNGAGTDAFIVQAQGNAYLNATAVSTIGSDALSRFYVYDDRGGANASGIAVYRANNVNATGYSYTTIDAAVKGHCYWGNNYSTGIYGDSEHDYPRSAAVLGADYGGSYWGAFGYKNSGSAGYGVYATAGLATGAGYAQNNIITGIASGNFGGVIGSWTHGEVMGQVNSGALFASYNLGDQYTSGHQAEIVTIGDKRVAAFSITSTDIKVYADGEGSLNGTSVFVPFDKDYAQMLGAKPRITVSPVGSSASIFIKSVDKTGFTVASDAAANVQFSWIAVGKRIDADSKPELPEALADKNFDANMKGVMFNENDREHSATPVWYDGQKVRFDAQPEEKRVKEKDPTAELRRAAAAQVNEAISSTAAKQKVTPRDPNAPSLEKNPVSFPVKQANTPALPGLSGEGKK